MNAILLLALALVPGQAPPLTCAQPVVDRGSVRGGPAMTQTFEVVNRDAPELTIVHVQPSCGCLAPKLTGRTLKAGESATVEIHIGTISQPEGDNLWTVRLFYRIAGSDVDQTLDLQVKAKLVREVVLEPAALRLSGRPGLGCDVTLTDRRTKPMEIAGVFASSNRLRASADSGWQHNDGAWVRKIHVEIAPECPAGKYDEVVQIASRDLDYQEIRVPVTVLRKGTQYYQVSPAELRLESTTGTVLIRDREGRAVEIEKVDADDPGLTCQFVPGEQAAAAVSVNVTPGQTPARSSNLRVHVKSPAAQVVTVPVTYPGGK